MEINTKKIAIVTGGASGIGLAIAKKFVQNNMTTIIVGRDKNKLSAAKDEMGELCIPISFDLNDLSSIPALVDQVIDRKSVV